MAIVFKIEGERLDLETGANYVEVCASNAADLIAWLGYEVDVDGHLDMVFAPGDLRARCEKRLAPTPENLASDLPRGGATFGRVTVAGRRMGYLTEKTAALLKLAELAGDRMLRSY